MQKNSIVESMVCGAEFLVYVQKGLFCGPAFGAQRIGITGLELKGLSLVVWMATGEIDVE